LVIANRAFWHRTAELHVAADLGRIGSILVWTDPPTGTWSVCVRGAQQSRHATAAKAQSAGTRLARELLQEGLHRLDELDGRQVSDLPGNSTP
jgi:hypothetical protein